MSHQQASRRVSCLGLLALLLAGCGRSQVEPLTTSTPVPSIGFAEIEGIKVYYEMAGEGKPLILIHGGNMDSRMWDDQFQVFTEHYWIIRYDVPGFGKSEGPTSAYTNSAALRGLMAYLGIEKAWIIGLSLGGRIALDFAVEYPKMVDGLILASSGLSGFEWSSDAIARSRAIMQVAKEQGAEQAAEKWLQDPYMAPAMENPAISGRIRQMVMDNAHIWLDENHEQMIAPPAIGRIKGITAPVLIIVGARDVEDIQLIADIVESAIPGTNKVVMENTGHIANMENPEGFNHLVLDFINR